jgi:hypothetical protein
MTHSGILTSIAFIPRSRALLCVLLLPEHRRPNPRYTRLPHVLEPARLLDLLLATKIAIGSDIEFSQFSDPSGCNTRSVAAAEDETFSYVLRCSGGGQYRPSAYVAEVGHARNVVEGWECWVS